MSTVASLSATGSISGGISISGLGNGTDFTSMIDELKKIEMIPMQRMLKWKADWRARQEAFKMVREQLVNLRNVAQTMNTMDKFLVKSGLSSDTKVATATASSDAIANTYKLEVFQVATTSIWSLENEFYANTTNINTSGSNQTFSYEYAGTVRNITVPPNTTLENFKNMINNDAGNPGVRASLIKGANGYSFQLKGMDQGTANTLNILNSDGLDGFPALSDYAVHTVKYDTELTDPTTSITNKETNFIFSYNGNKYTVVLDSGDSLNDLVQKINAKGSGVTASLNQVDGRYELVMTGNTAGVAITAPKNPGLTQFNKPLESVVAVDPGTWHIQHSQNAKIKIDNWPQGDPLEVSSNKIEGVVEGIVFNIQDVGTTNISVVTDTEAIKENVLALIDAINSFRVTITELTKYDSNKATVDLEYADSLYDMQKGSILTGNYGVQLLSSQLKQATAGMAKGFRPRTEFDDVWLGDLFTSLSQIGIKTNATGQGGDIFGLLDLNTDPSLPTLDDALAKNPEAVAELFAAINKGVSDSMNFSFVSSMQTITRPGNFNVSYDIDSSGNVANAYINGKLAKYYPDTGQLGLLRENPSSTQSNAVSASSEGSTDFSASIEVLETAQKASLTIATSITEPEEAFVPDTGGTFSYTYNGQTVTIDVDAEYNTLGHIASKINSSLDNPGVRASVVWDKTSSTYSLKLEAREDGYGKRDNGQANAFDSAVGMSFTPLASSSVSTLDGRDAEYRIDGGDIKKSATNTFTDSRYYGVTFTIKDKTTAGTPATVSGQKHNDADGLYIQIDNTAAGSYTGQVRIKQGKINELLELLTGTSQKPEEGMLGSKGALQLLMDNYDKIIEGIDKKIERETSRISKWERTQRLRFARLDAYLKQYDSLASSIESQIKQLPGNSSKS